MKRFLLFLFASLLISMSAFAQVSTAVLAVPSKATIISPLTLELTTGTTLDFGTITRNAFANDVTVSTANERSATFDYTLLASGPSSVPTFTITGQVGQAYTVTLPASGVIKLASGSDRIEVWNFISTADGSLNTASETFTVGATLKVGIDQASGEYSATFPVTVAYN